MKNITKTLLVLVSSLSISFAATAGELTLTGSAKASYSIGGSDDSMDKGVGVSNELKVAASGELDNGYTWNYHLDLDPGASGAMVQDDAALTINTNGMGTVGFFDGEGSLHSNLAWGIGAMGTGSDYAGTMTISYGNDIDGETNVQYHTPADMLPYGITAKIGYQPNKGDTTGGNDYKSTGGINPEGLAGSSMLQYRVDAAPIDGLKIGADYATEDGGSTATAQSNESGAAYAQYAIGNFKLGYGKSLYAPGLIAKNGNATMYETDSYGVEFAVNDALSLSYTNEKSEETTNVIIVAGAAGQVKTKLEADIDSIQAAYVIGGATLGVAITETANADYISGKDEKVTMFSLAMEF
tara:strand:- start:201 stop:1262 length:1062 start_codon:yes stop_codon:yes gene_type:complete